MIKFIFTLLLLLFTQVNVYASIDNYTGPKHAPFGDHMITSQYEYPGPRHHSDGSYWREAPHCGVDIDAGGYEIMYAPYPGVAEIIDNDPDGFGYFVLFTPDVSVDPTHKTQLVFGHVADSSHQFYNGGNTIVITAEDVIKGIPIAVIDGPSGVGAEHLHFEYRPDGFSNPPADPVIFLAEQFGIVLGNYRPSGGAYFHPTYEYGSLTEKLGNFLSGLMEIFTDFSKDAYKNLTNAALWLLFIFCIIDLTIPIILSGMVIDKGTILRKILKYSFAFGFMYIYPKIINDGLLGFARTISKTAAGESQFVDKIAEPQIILQKVMFFLNAPINKITHYGFFDTIRNLDVIIWIYLLVFLVSAVFIWYAISIALTFVEFYVSAGLCVITVPFGVTGFTKFVPEGSIGHLVSSSLKLLFTSFIMMLCIVCIKDADPPNLFENGTVDTTITTTVQVKDKDGKNLKTELKDLPSNIYNENIKKWESQSPDVVRMIRKIAPEYGIDERVAMTIAYQESTFGLDPNVQGINVFQIDPNQDVVNPNGSGRINIRDLYPLCDTDLEQNVRAGMVMLKDKIAMDDGDIVEGIKDYNGGGNSTYLEEFMEKYTELTGQPLAWGVHTKITTEQLDKFVLFCVVLITLGIFGIFLPQRLVAPLSGPIEIP